MSDGGVVSPQGIGNECAKCPPPPRGDTTLTPVDWKMLLVFNHTTLLFFALTGAFPRPLGVATVSMHRFSGWDTFCKRLDALH